MTRSPADAGDGGLAIVHLPDGPGGLGSEEGLSRWQDLGCVARFLEPGHPVGERCWLCSPVPGAAVAGAGAGVRLTAGIARAERLGIIRGHAPQVTDALFPPRPASGGTLALVTPEDLEISAAGRRVCGTGVVFAAIAEAGLRPGGMHDLLRYAETGWNRADRVHAPGSLSCRSDDDFGTLAIGKLHDDTLNLVMCDSWFGRKQTLLVVGPGLGRAPYAAAAGGAGGRT